MLRRPLRVGGFFPRPARWSAVVRGMSRLDTPFEDLHRLEIRSAGKRYEQVREIPASATVITRDEIVRCAWPTLEERLRNVRGFSFSISSRSALPGCAKQSAAGSRSW